MKKFKVIFAALAVVGMIAFYGLRNEAKSACLYISTSGYCDQRYQECVKIAFNEGNCSHYASNPMPEEL